MLYYVIYSSAILLILQFTGLKICHFRTVLIVSLVITVGVHYLYCFTSLATTRSYTLLYVQVNVSFAHRVIKLD